MYSMCSRAITRSAHTISWQQFKYFLHIYLRFTYCLLLFSFDESSFPSILQSSMAFVEYTRNVVEYIVPGPIAVLRSRRHHLCRQQVKLKQRARAGAHIHARTLHNCSFTLKIWRDGVGEAALCFVPALSYLRRTKLQ